MLRRLVLAACVAASWASTATISASNPVLGTSDFSGNVAAAAPNTEISWTLGVSPKEYEVPVNATVTFKFSTAHNLVLMTTEDAYDRCSRAGVVELASTSHGGGSGSRPNSYTLKLTKPGVAFLVCNIDDHCEDGQKVWIRAVAPGAPAGGASAAASPPPPDAAVASGGSGGYGARPANPCFPSSATVTLGGKHEGKSARLDALKEGDVVLVVTADGTLTTDTVSLLSLADPDTADEYVELQTDTHHTLRLTPGHHIPVGESCCAELKTAAELVVDDTVWVAPDGQGGAHPSAVPAKVATVSRVAERGHHSPVLTNGGYPIVDGVVTAFDSIGKVRAARHGLSWLLALCKATGSCDALRRTLGAGKYIDGA